MCKSCDSNVTVVWQTCATEVMLTARTKEQTSSHVGGHWDLSHIPCTAVPVYTCSIYGCWAFKLLYLRPVLDWKNGTCCWLTKYRIRNFLASFTDNRSDAAAVWITRNSNLSNDLIPSPHGNKTTMKQSITPWASLYKTTVHNASIVLSQPNCLSGYQTFRVIIPSKKIR